MHSRNTYKTFVPSLTLALSISIKYSRIHHTKHFANCSYDPPRAHDFWQILVSTAKVFERFRAKFTGKYDYRLIGNGVGHNLPQEAPDAFAKAVIDVDHF